MTALAHHIDMAVTQLHEALLEGIKLQLLPLGQADRLHGAQIGLHRLHQRARRGHDDLQRALRVGGCLIGCRARCTASQSQAPQHPHPRAHRLHGRRELLVRQRLPRREQLHRLPEHVLQHRREVLGLPTRGRHHQHGAALRQRAHHERPRAIGCLHVQARLPHMREHAAQLAILGGGAQHALQTGRVGGRDTGITMGCGHDH